MGSNCMPEAEALAAHAAGCGVDGIAAMAPFFFRPGRVEDLVDSLAGIANAAPGVPFYYYHIPALTGVALPMREFLTRGRDRMPSLSGIKYTSPSYCNNHIWIIIAEGSDDIINDLMIRFLSNSD